jgi:hypothetical protein
VTIDSEARVHLAEELLREVVFRARARQAARAGLSGARLDEPAGPGRCGLGEGGEVELDLSERGERIARDLFGAKGVRAAHLGAAMRAWIEKQDALDRKRNHFLRDFRTEHGFDRNGYTPAVMALYEQGLERLNGEASAVLDAAARSLLGGS